MKSIYAPICLLVLGCLVGGAAAQHDDRIYARVTTRDGEVLEGPIRWGTNEASWFDVLDASKRLPERNRREAEEAGLDDERRREVRLLGYTILSYGGEEFPDSAQAGIRFGHIERLEPRGRRRAELTLRSGQRVTLEGSSDLGSSLSLYIEHPSRGIVEVDWRDLDVVDFLLDKKASESEYGKRLYGTVVTRSSGGFTGYVCWDMDEVFEGDILDGEERSTDREIPFSDIASIDRNSSRSALVTLRSGDELRLSGTNDVDDDNRGILVIDPELGQVRLDWDEFEKVVFAPAPAAKLNFDGGHRLKGTVTTEDGASYTGEIRWDNDEEYSWEFLDGSYRSIEFDIEFGKVRSIERKSHRGSVVTLMDGRSFELDESNDVDEDNKGIFITRSDGSVKAVRWSDFARVVFVSPGDS